MLKRVLATTILALAVAPSAVAGGPTMTIGATEDIVKQPTLVAAKAQMDKLRLVGLRGVRITQEWAPGETEPDDAALRPGPVRLRHVRGERGSRAPVRAGLRDRQRAEPAPLLAHAVRPP